MPRVLRLFSGFFVVVMLAAASAPAGAFTMQTQPSDQKGARRPLPKPPTGPRGFEQTAGRDASNRLIRAGATRDVLGQRTPRAPQLGLALDPNPFFEWGPAIGATAYRFTLFDGDVNEDPAAKALYNTTVKTTYLRYPKGGPTLAPGKIYSWRVSTMGPGSGEEFGPAVAFFVLAQQDAADVRAALKKANLVSPKTTEERLRQAKVLEEWGVWYDALRIAHELSVEKPDDETAEAYYESLLDKLGGDEL